MSETLVLDPSAVVANRTEFDLTPFIAYAGPDFGDAAITEALAEAGRFGSLPVDFVYPNRTITIPLSIIPRSGKSFEDVRTALQQKVALFQAHNGYISRQTSVGTVYAEITSAQLKLGGSTAQAMWSTDTDAVLTLSTLPDWFGNEITRSALTHSGWCAQLETPIKGDFASRVRLIIAELSNNDQFGLIWGFRNYHYSADATAALHYEAEDLTVITGASIVAAGDAGAVGALEYSGDHGVYVSSISQTTVPYNPQWVQLLTTTLDDGDLDLTHIGNYRMWARACSLGSGTCSVRLRLTYDVGDLALDQMAASGTHNPAASIPLYGGWYLLDLGQVRLDESPVGTHRWKGVLEVMATNASENIVVDEIFMVPVSEGYGTLRSSSDAVAFASQQLEVRTDGAFRNSGTGDFSSYGRVAVTGDLPRLPVSGLEVKPTEIFVKPTRSNLGSVADAGIDGFSLQIKYRPSYLFIPE